VIETVVASVVLVLCVALLARMALSPRYQQRVDGLARRLVQAGRRVVVACYREPMARRQAARAAAEAIRRARRRSAGSGKDGAAWEGEREGNLYKPRSFRRPRKPH
jgi:hypothetical protein